MIYAVTPLRAALLVLILAAGIPAAKSADDYVHGGAAKYIQGRLQEAGVEVEEGLRLHPDDARLKALADQLKKMKDQQKKDQGGQDSPGGDQNQDKQDKQDSSGQGKQDGKQDEKDKQDEEKAKEEEAKEQEKKDKEKGGQDEQAQQPKPEEGKEGDSSGQAAAPAKPGEMSKEEAERLLNSYQDDEKREQKDMQKRYRKRVETEQDW
jgi:Ca-activated chloride channel family protein